MTMTIQNQRVFENAILSARSLPGGENPFNFIDLGTPGGDTFFDGCGLKKDISYTTVSATFSKVKNHPDKIRIRTTYWRAENEVSAVYPIAVAREFYRKLKKVGFEAY